MHPLAQRLRDDGVRTWLDVFEILPGDSIPIKIEEGLEHSRVLVLFMSANAFGSDWSQLEARLHLDSATRSTGTDDLFP